MESFFENILTNIRNFIADILYAYRTQHRKSCCQSQKQTDTPTRWLRL
jgi:hypothetical protein